MPPSLIDDALDPRVMQPTVTTLPPTKNDARTTAPWWSEEHEARPGHTKLLMPEPLREDARNPRPTQPMLRPTTIQATGRDVHERDLVESGTQSDEMDTQPLPCLVRCQPWSGPILRQWFKLNKVAKAVFF